MTHNPQTMLDKIAEVRDMGPISSRNTSKGALIQETFHIFNVINAGIDVSEVKQRILVENVLHKTSYETRRKIWNAIGHRYLAVCPQWAGQALAAASQNGVQSPEFLSLAYLYFVLRDRLTFEFIVGPVWNSWQQGVTSVSNEDFFAFLEKLAADAPAVKKWRETTRVRLSQMTLASLRDFGLLRGKQVKHIQRPSVAPETVYHLLLVLQAEGKEGRAVLEAPDWRIFLWSQTEVANALNGLAQRRWIEFERAGQTVILRLLRMPAINDE